MLNLWKPQPKKRSGFVRPPPVVPGVSLSRYTNVELGVRIARRSGQPRQDPGIAWARLMNQSNRPEKDGARAAVLRLFLRFPFLSALTFPASEWRFENALLLNREGERGIRSGKTENTRIVCVERDEAVFRAACHNIPRGRTGTSRGRIRSFNAPSFASAAVGTGNIRRFYRTSFEQYAMGERGEDGAGVRVFDAAWLDFNGQLTQPRLDAIERFWNRQLRSLLVITLLELHQSDWMRGRIKQAGGTEGLLASRLPDSEIEDVTRYGDGAPMVQIALRRVAGMPRLLSLIAPSRALPSSRGGER